LVKVAPGVYLVLSGTVTSATYEALSVQPPGPETSGTGVVVAAVVAAEVAAGGGDGVELASATGGSVGAGGAVVGVAAPGALQANAASIRHIPVTTNGRWVLLVFIACLLEEMGLLLYLKTRKSVGGGPYAGNG
jgi:hypothetical protein